jgi:hypothetical protein
LEEDEEKLIDNKRLFAYILVFVGFLLLSFSIIVYLPLKFHVVVFAIFFVLGLIGVVCGLYILVKTKPEPEKGEEYDEEIPDESVDFNDWAKQASKETYKSERPDPSQYKPKKEYKAFPAVKKEEKKSEASTSGKEESSKKGKEKKS